MKAYYKRELLYEEKKNKNKTPAKKNTFFIERKKSDVKIHQFSIRCEAEKQQQSPGPGKGERIIKGNQ